MDDLISRQEAIDAVENIDCSDGVGISALKCEAVDDGVTAIKALPSAQPDSKELSFTQKKLDTISRQAAIRWVKTECNPYGKPTLDFESGKKVIEHLKQMPSAQPEIVRCKDCIKREICRTSTTWAVAPKNDWYCADAKRRTDGSNQQTGGD